MMLFIYFFAAINKFHETNKELILCDASYTVYSELHYPSKTALSDTSPNYNEHGQCPMTQGPLTRFLPWFSTKSCGLSQGGVCSVVMEMVQGPCRFMTKWIISITTEPWDVAESSRRNFVSVHWVKIWLFSMRWCLGFFPLVCNCHGVQTLMFTEWNYRLHLFFVD